MGGTTAPAPATFAASLPPMEPTCEPVLEQSQAAAPPTNQEGDILAATPADAETKGSPDVPQDSTKSSLSAAKENWQPTLEANQATEPAHELVHKVHQIWFNLKAEARRMEPDLLQARIDSLGTAIP